MYLYRSQPTSPPGASPGVADGECTGGFIAAEAVLDFQPVVVTYGHDGMASLNPQGLKAKAKGLFF